ncbi:hypothetical protein BJ742DRAFT_839957 [Cladochytrium replicatum]|nr:hypothetical protein BJ742DRAFT_839957 [Cladochytrium replicatum]
MSPPRSRTPSLNRASNPTTYESETFKREHINLGPLQAEGDSNAYLLPPVGAAANNIRSTSTGGFVDLTLNMDRTMYMAGGEVTGRFEIRCRSGSKVKLGRIEMTLVGFEEVIDTNSKAPNQRRVLFAQKLLIQGMQPELGIQTPLVPSDAVVPGPPDEHGMWQAKKGATIFQFKIPLGPTQNVQAVGSDNDDITGAGAGFPLPGSYWSRRHGGIRYVVSGSVDVKIRSEKRPTLVAYREIQVLEHCADPVSLIAGGVTASRVPNGCGATLRSKPFKATGTAKVGGWMMKKGELRVDAEILMPGKASDLCWTGIAPDDLECSANSGCVWVAGSMGFVGVTVRNDSKKKLKQLNVTLYRRLKTFSRSSANQSLVLLNFSRVEVSERVLQADSPPSKPAAALAKYPGDGFAEEDFMDGGPSQYPGSKLAWWSGVLPGEEKSLVVDLVVPTWARTVSNGLLIDVSYVVQVAAVAAGGARAEVEIPVSVLHPASLYQTLPTPKRSKSSGTAAALTGGGVEAHHTAGRGVSLDRRPSTATSLGADEYEEEDEDRQTCISSNYGPQRGGMAAHGKGRAAYQDDYGYGDPYEYAGSTAGDQFVRPRGESLVGGQGPYGGVHMQQPGYDPSYTSSPRHLNMNRPRSIQQSQLFSGSSAPQYGTPPVSAFPDGYRAAQSLDHLAALVDGGLQQSQLSQPFKRPESVRRQEMTAQHTVNLHTYDVQSSYREVVEQRSRTPTSSRSSIRSSVRSSPHMKTYVDSRGKQPDMPVWNSDEEAIKRQIDRMFEDVVPVAME